MDVMAEKGAFDEAACCLAHLLGRQSAPSFAFRLRHDAGFSLYSQPYSTRANGPIHREKERGSEEEGRARARKRGAEMKKARERERDRKRGGERDQGVAEGNQAFMVAEKGGQALFKGMEAVEGSEIVLALRPQSA